MEDTEREELLLPLQKLRSEEEEEEEEEEKKKGSMEELFPLEEVEKIIDYAFKDKRLLEQAFTHGSYEFERLEYVGDSVLNLLIAKDDYFTYGDLPPGKLTRLRAANVDTEKLARVAVNHELYKYLRHSKPLLPAQIREFMEAILGHPLHSNGLIDVPKVLADMVESTIGAVFIDSNSSTDITWKVVKSLMEPIITPATLQTHPVTKLYEFCQKHGFKLQIVDLWRQSGAFEIFVDGEFVERAIYSPKRMIALNRAANNAYNEVVRKLSKETTMALADG